MGFPRCKTDHLLYTGTVYFESKVSGQFVLIAGVFWSSVCKIPIKLPMELAHPSLKYIPDPCFSPKHYFITVLIIG